MTNAASAVRSRHVGSPPGALRDTEQHDERDESRRLPHGRAQQWIGVPVQPVIHQDERNAQQDHRRSWHGDVSQFDTGEFLDEQVVLCVGTTARYLEDGGTGDDTHQPGGRQKGKRLPER